MLHGTISQGPPAAAVSDILRGPQGARFMRHLQRSVLRAVFATIALVLVHHLIHAQRQIGRVIVDPKNANVVFVAALGHVYGANADRGVFRSRDGGATWLKVLFKSYDLGAIDLAFDPVNSQIVYATLWNTRRPPWSIY